MVIELIWPIKTPTTIKMKNLVALLVFIVLFNFSSAAVCNPATARVLGVEPSHLICQDDCRTGEAKEYQVSFEHYSYTPEEMLVFNKIASESTLKCSELV